MREIKFRTWHKPTQLMGDVALIDFYNEKIGILYADPIIQGESIQKYNFNEIELMQSTGLKDKNGVEVYEGDIVNLHWFYFDGGSESEQELYAKEILNYRGMMCFGWQDNYIPLALMDWHEESIEIIGNIYQTPELLGESDV